MNTLDLSGLHGTHPLGALAAFGLLRVLSGQKEFDQPRLAWRHETGFTAVLCAGSSLEKERVLDVLTERMAGRANAPFLRQDDVKLKPTEFAGFRSDALAKVEEAAEFFAAFGSEVVQARSTGDVKPTAFHLTAGQQKFLKSARELAQTLDPSGKRPKNLSSPRDAFERALFGPWTYEDPQHSLGWDPATEALHALSDRAPTDTGPSSERAAVWLAFEALPLFPCLPCRWQTGTLYLHTRGFDRRAKRFRWPLWAGTTKEKPTIPLSLESLRSLIGLPDLYADTLESERLALRGVVAVYESACYRDANGRGTLRYPKLVYGSN